MKEFLSPGSFIDSDHPAVVSFAEEHAKGNAPLERAVSLYYAVRDRIRYNPFLDFSQDGAFRASQCILTGEGFCICLLYTSPSPRDISGSRMPSSA